MDAATMTGPGPARRLGNVQAMSVTQYAHAFGAAEDAQGASREEKVASFFELAAEPNLAFEEKISRLLALGCELLELDMGLVSRVEGSLYTVRHAHGPDWAPRPGDQFQLSRTFCQRTLAEGEVVAVHNTAQSDMRGHPCYKDTGLEAYIGAPLMIGETTVGTLNFSSPAPRSAPFGDRDRGLVRFLARWLGREWELEREHRAQQEANHLLRAVLEAVPDALIVADANRRITMVNPGVERIMGYSPEAILGRQTAVLYETMDEYEHYGRERFNAAVSGEGLKSFEAHLRRADGSLFRSEGYTNVVRSGDKVLGFLAVARDITKRHAREESRNQLISNVSHELRTPLTSIYGALKVLESQAGELPEAMQKLLSVARGNAERLTELINDILDVERLDSDRVEQRRERQDLGALLELSVAELAQYARNHGVTLELAPPPAGGAQHAQVDRNRILQVLSNLISNAVKVSPRGGAVTVGLLDGDTGFFVQDRGPGIPEQLQPVLYDRFTRGDATGAGDRKGTGLGMSIVKAIVDQHLGDIAFETAPGAGTTFRVSLPPCTAGAD